MATGCKDNRDKSIDNQNGKEKSVNSTRLRALQEAIKTANKPGDPVTITFATVELRLSDVQLLRGPRSINEAIISFYYSYLESERYKSNSDMVFIPPETSHCMAGMESDEMEPIFELHELNSKLFAFFVLMDDHGDKKYMRTTNHFTLIVLSRPEKTFFYYDSCSNNSKTSSKQTQHFVQELGILMNCRQWQLKAIRANVLLNTAYDCGIRVLCMTDIVANHVNRFECIEGVKPLHQDAVSAKRTEMLKLIFMLGGKITL